MTKMTKRRKEDLITMASIKAVVGFQIPIMQLREVSAAARTELELGHDYAAMVLAARAACHKVGTKTDQYAPLPGEVS